MDVYICDKDIAYVSVLKELLSEKFKDIRFHSENAKKPYTGTVLLIDEDLEAPKDFSGRILKLRKEEHPLEPNEIYKYSSLSVFCEKLRYCFENTENPVQLLCCVTGDSSIAFRNQAISGILDTSLKRGALPILVQICPRYLLYAPDVPRKDIGNLSDLMVHISSNETAIPEPSLYLEPAEGPYMLLRPFEQTDDLYDCSPEHIRRLISLLRNWAMSRKEPTEIVSMFWSVPFSFIRSGCMPADKLYVIEGPGSVFARELSSLLGQMKNISEIVPISESGGGIPYV